MDRKIRVVVVDDHPIYRDGVIRTLEENQIDVVGQGVNTDEAIHLVNNLGPDIVLLDIRLPGDGIICARNIADNHKSVKVVILTGSENEIDLRNSLKAGARGYILKGVTGPELINIVNRVAAGEIYVTPTLAGHLLYEEFAPQSDSDQPKKLLDGLTRREQEILDLVATGLTNREIADKLYLSENTVKQYLTRILDKLNVRNRIEAALLVQRTNRQN